MSRNGYAYIRGLQGETLGPESVACKTKHFPGGGPRPVPGVGADDQGEDATGRQHGAGDGHRHGERVGAQEPDDGPGSAATPIRAAPSNAVALPAVSSYRAMTNAGIVGQTPHCPVERAGGMGKVGT